LKTRLLLAASAALALLSLLGLIWWLTHPAAAPTPGPVSAVKLYVAEDGLYRVPLADLEAAGLAGAAQRPHDLALTWHDQPIPRFIEGEALIFYGQGSRSPYAAEAVYQARLTSDGVNPQERSVPLTSLPPATTYTATSRLEEEQVYYARATQDAHRWLWVSLTAPRTFTISFELTGLVAGPGRLRVALLGGTQSPVQPDHHVRLTLNGQVVADASWDGQTPYLVDVSLPTGTLRDGENTLVTHLPGDTGALADIALLDWAEVEYPRHLVAVGDRLAFSGPGGAYQLRGFSGPVLACDVVVPTSPVRLTGLASGSVLAFADAAPGPHEYVFAGPGGLHRPTRIVPVHPSAAILRDPATQADWLLIAPADLIPALQPLVEWRQQQGLSVFVADIQAVYDAFSYGEATPQAIKDLVALAYNSWARPAPRFVVLAGTASYDYRNVLDAPRQNLVPTCLLHSPLVGETASDNWFADVVGDDGRPELALGRLSVGTVTEARSLSARIVAYERNERDTSAGDWRRRALFVADGKEPTFRTLTERLIAGQIPSDMVVVRVYQEDLEKSRSQLLQEWNQGALLLTYVGHAGITVWTDKQLFRLADVAGLRNGQRLPFVATMTCLDGYYHHPQVQCLAEALLLAPQGGAIAVLAPTSESLPTDQEDLIRGLLIALFDPTRPTIGEAVAQAKRGLPDTSAARDLMATYNLLGDPATRLAWP